MSGPDMSLLMAAVDFGTVVTAVLAVASALVVVFVARKGAFMVLSAVRGSGSGGGFTQSDWDSMDEDDRGFYGVSSLDDLNSRYTKS